MTQPIQPTDTPIDGLQAERTTLAWTRTSFAFLVNGALLALKDLPHSQTPAALFPASFAAIVALCTYIIAVRRQHTLLQRPLPKQITPRRQVHIIGIATLILIGTTIVAQLIQQH